MRVISAAVIVSLLVLLLTFLSLRAIDPEAELFILEDVPARPFEQTGVALFAQDCFVNFARALLLDDVCFYKGVANPHSEPGDGGVLR